MDPTPIDQLYSEWHDAVIGGECPVDEHQSRARIRAMRDDALPHIFQILVREPFRGWSPLLSEITGENPVPKHFRRRSGIERHYWLEWARSHDFEPGIQPIGVPMAVIDLELTCWESNADRDMEIIELGAAVLMPSDDGMQLGGEFRSFVRPIRDPILSDYCRNLTGIIQDDVDGAVSLKDVMESFESWFVMSTGCSLDRSIVCAWGSDGDAIHRECLRQGITCPISYQRNLKDEHAILKGLRKPIGLKRALELEGMGFSGDRHRALDDARNTAALMLRAWPTQVGQ